MHCAIPDWSGRGLRTCNWCKRVRYFSVECQRANWPTHKPDCKAPAPKAASKEPSKGDKKATPKEKGTSGGELAL